MTVIYGTLGDNAPANSDSVSPNTVLGLGCWNTEYQPAQTLVAAMTLNFDAAISEITVNGNELISQQKIDAFRTVYVDNREGASPVDFLIQTTLQRVTCPPYSQAYLPLMAPNPPEIIVESINQLPLRVHFLNVLISPTVITIGAP